MKMIKIMVSMLPAILLCLIIQKAIAMESEQPKELLLKIKSNPTLGTAFLIDSFGRESLKTFCLTPALSDPCIMVSMRNPLQKKGINTDDFVKKFEDNGANVRTLNEVKEDLAGKYIKMFFPVSQLIGKKHGDTVLLLKTEKNEIHRYIYHDSENQLTKQLQSDMANLRNNVNFQLANPKPDQTYINSLIKDLLDEKIVAIHNDQFIHGPCSYFARIPSQ